MTSSLSFLWSDAKLLLVSFAAPLAYSRLRYTAASLAVSRSHVSRFPTICRTAKSKRAASSIGSPLASFRDPGQVFFHSGTTIFPDFWIC